MKFIYKAIIAASVLLLSIPVFNTADTIQAQDRGSEFVASSFFSRFFSDVSMELRFGMGQYDGNYHRRGAYYLNAPLPPEGAQVAITFSKPVYSYGLMDLNARWGFDILTYYAPGGDFTRVRAADTRGGIVPINIQNLAFGTTLGFSAEFNLFRRVTLEPMLDLALYIHNPRTDGFVDRFGRRVDVSQGRPFSMYRNYILRTVRASRASSDDAIPRFIGSINPGLKASFDVGNTRLFFYYSANIFLNEYFDATRDAGREAQNIYGLTGLGVSLPIGSGRTGDVRRPTRDSGDAIRMLARSVETDEDLATLQAALDNRLVDPNTPGMRANELAFRAQETTVYLIADSLVGTQMVRLPEANYVMGLTDVDEFTMQLAGRVRVSVPSFKMDKYAVTNEQYRAFLIDMGVDISQHPRVNNLDRDPLADSLGIASTGDIGAVFRDAGLDTLIYANQESGFDPNNFDLMNLMPDFASWEREGLNDLIPYETYFFGEGYLNHPVVSVNWYQAKLFAAWAGKRLPTETEWEYAAKSGVSGRVFPWDGHQIQTRGGTYRANYRQERGVFDLDGYVLMAPVNSFQPNDFGLYQMAGNVSEWVLDSYNPSYSVLDTFGSLSFVSPFYINYNETRKVHRGGSWNSSAFFIGSGVRNFRDMSQASPTIGIRLAKTVEQSVR